MRKSGYHVDDAGDASNTEIGPVPTCLLEPVSLSHHVFNLANLVLCQETRESGEGLSRGPDRLSVEQQQVRCQTVDLSQRGSRDHCPMFYLASILINERVLAHEGSGSGALCQALFRIDSI